MVWMNKINHPGNPTLYSQGQLFIFVCLAQDRAQSHLSPSSFSSLQLLAPKPLLFEKPPKEKNLQVFLCLLFFFALISRHGNFLTLNCSNCLIICLTKSWFTAVKCTLAAGWTFHSLLQEKPRWSCFAWSGDGPKSEHQLLLQTELGLLWFPSLWRCPQDFMGRITVFHLCRLVSKWSVLGRRVAGGFVSPVFPSLFQEDYYL